MWGSTPPLESRGIRQQSHLGKRFEVDIHSGRRAYLADAHVRQEPVELLVIANGQLDVAGQEPLLPESRFRARQLRPSDREKGKRSTCLLSRAALPASSRISAARYSSTAAR